MAISFKAISIAILAVAIYDIYCTVKMAGHTDVSRLVLVKTIGLVLAVSVMNYVITTKRKTVVLSIFLSVLCGAMPLLISLVY